jgi:alpha-N-arabinofuranosidase
MNLSYPKIIHVSILGDDSHEGSEQKPLRHINTAAQMARPGDTVRVHSGTYREKIHPLYGGISEAQRITYEAAEGEAVNILGSEVLSNWIKQGDSSIWSSTVSNSLFGDHNPFGTLIAGDWFKNLGRPHHTAGIYLNGRECLEAATVNNLPAKPHPFWYAEVGENETTIWLNCAKENPNEHCVEINARATIFYPLRTGINYITVRGFNMRHAATNWAPPTSEQIGIIGTNWSKGWVIENNTISNSRCVGVTLGKHGDEHDNTSEDSPEGYVETIRRGLKRGWNRDNIGGHIVRNNTISHCGQAGIVGSLGAIFSVVEGNVIHHIHTVHHFAGEEQAGIKFHAPIDTLIANNHIHHSIRGIWLDWMTQGTRITRNLCHDNADQDLFLEVNHGPFVVDHNLFLSDKAVLSISEGGAFAHNLIAGKMIRVPDLSRDTPYHPQSSTEIEGFAAIRGGDERYFNNLFMNANGLSEVKRKLDHASWLKNVEFTDNNKAFPNVIQNNQALPCAFVLTQEEDGWYLNFESNDSKFIGCQRVDTKALGITQVSNLPYLNYDGRPLILDSDYLGRQHPEFSTVAGPFASESLMRRIKVFDNVSRGCPVS